MLFRSVFSFDIPIRQFREESELNLEVAAAAFDADGLMMNAVVNVARKDLHREPGSAEPAQFFRVEQELEVPQGATSVRVAVRDATNDRTGAMQINLPLASEGAGQH